MYDILKITKVRDIVSAFKHDVEDRSGRPFSMFRWPPRLIYFHLVNNRATLYYRIRKENKRENNFEDYTQVLPCVEMKKVDYVECPCAPASHCEWMKSVEALPDFVGTLPTTIMTLDGMTEYTYVPWENFSLKMKSRVSTGGRRPLYTVRVINEKRHLYTYILKKDMVHAKSVMVAGIPIDPIEMFLFPVCGKSPDRICSFMELPFSIEKRLTSQLYEMTYISLINKNNNIQLADTKNDDRNNAIGPVQRR
jgi:hypothetical protein